MSLHKFADMVAKQGRGEDSLLIHMTPDEVQRLQKFAEANGRSLTINPETGLPEAGMLSDLFKAVAPIALGAFLGPGAFGIAGLGLSAGTAGLVTGGLTTLATGSLSRGLMAGLGAYGGAGLAEGFANAGANAMTTAGVGDYASSLAERGIYPTLESGAVNPAFGEEASKIALEAKKQAFAAPMTDRLSAGFDVAKADPLGFAKDNFKYLGAAATPIMAGAMVPTTTKMPENTSPAYIRQKLYDPYTQTYKTLAPVRADQWGNRSFSDAYTNPQTGEMATLQPRAPGMAGGGIVALAIGGEAKSALEDAYAKNDVDAINKIVSENKITAEDVGNTWKGFDTSGIAGLNLYTPPADNTGGGGGGGGAPTYTQYTEDQMASFLSNPANKNIDINQAIKDTNADPAAVNKYLASLTSPFVGSTWDKGGSGTLGIYNNMVGIGVDPNEYYKAAIAANPNYAGWSKEDIARGYNLDKGAYALSSQLGGKVSDKDWVNFMDTNKYSVNDMAQAFGLSIKEVNDRYNAVKNAEKKVTGTGTNTSTSTTTTPTRVTDTVLPTNPTVNAPPGTRNPYGNVNNPGDLTFNPDGTITVQPNIPGRPYGGFSGMDEVKNAYTAGGGSLGYTAKAPRTIEEFNQLYNKQTGDSLAAYDYLMGKGGGKYPVQSKAASTAEGIMRPYWSAGMKYKPKFLSYDKEGKIVSNDGTGAKADAQAGALTKAQTIDIVDSTGESTQTYTAVLQKDGTYLAGNGKRYDVTGKEIAAHGGLMGYADGGVTGNGNLNLNIPLNVGGQGGGFGGGISSVNSTGDIGRTGGNMNPNTGTGGTSTYPGTLPINHPTNSSLYSGPGAINRTGGDFIPDMGPLVSYSPFSEEGRRKMDELAARTKGNPVTGPIPGGDYAAANGLDDTMTPGMMAENAANQQRNAALRASSAGSTPDMAALARRLGITGVGMADGGMTGYAMGGGLGSLGAYSDGGRLLKGPGDGVSDSIPATIGRNRQPARLADGEFVIPARIVSELGNGSTEAGAKKLYAMMDRVQKARGKTTGKNKVAANSRADKYLPA